MSAKVSARMAVRFRNPLMAGKSDGKKKSTDVYGDMPTLDYNCNITGCSKTVNTEEENIDLPCNCDRPASAVFCSKCGHIFTGHMRKICQRHPKVIHLMDKEECPRCKCKAMKEY